MWDGSPAADSVSHHGVRDERAGVLPTRSKKYQRCSNRDPSRDAKCGTVVPQQVDLFVRGEVWRHTEVSCTHNRTLGGQQRGYLRVPPRNKDGLEGL